MFHCLSLRYNDKTVFRLDFKPIVVTSIYSVDVPEIGVAHQFKRTSVEPGDKLTVLEPSLVIIIEE